MQSRVTASGRAGGYATSTPTLKATARIIPPSAAQLAPSRDAALSTRLQEACQPERSSGQATSSASEEDMPGVHAVIEELRRIESKMDSKMDSAESLVSRIDKLTVTHNRQSEALAKLQDAVNSIREDVQHLHRVNGGSFAGKVEVLETKISTLEDCITDVSRTLQGNTEETGRLMESMRGELNAKLLEYTSQSVHDATETSVSECRAPLAAQEDMRQGESTESDEPSLDARDAKDARDVRVQVPGDKSTGDTKATRKSYGKK